MDQHVYPEDAASTNTDPPAEPKRRRLLPILIAILVVGALVVGGVLYWLDARHYASTDDAFIDAHISQISPQVSGRVLRLAVDDNQHVTAGDLLVEIDPRPLIIQVEQAKAKQAEAAASLAQSKATLPVREADAAGAMADIKVAEADLVQARQDYARYISVNPKAITRQQVDQSSAATKTAEARLESRKQAAAGMYAQVEAARAAVDASAAAVQTADADLANAQLQLSYTQVVAPATGTITRRTVEIGNWVQPGQALLAVVQPACWVTANFKEGQLADMRPGQPVTIAVDARPDETLHAHVDSVQTGTGSIFSSLPAENATGNYVKVVQRLPVKLVFDRDDKQASPCERLHLAPGMSVIPRVKVR